MTITALPTPPSPSDSPAAFNAKAFDLLGALPTFVTEANALAADVSADEASATSAAGTASTHASTATAKAAEALISANSASTSAGTATTQAGIATTQAGIATTQAGTATTKAAEAAASAAALADKVAGPASATDNTLARFDGTTGKVVQGSSVSVDDFGNLTLSAGAMGYGTGAGGTVTQATSKATAVTLNKPSGAVTMHNAALAAGASVLFTLNNTFFGSNDTVVLTGKAWSARYRIETANSSSGLVGIRVTNTEAVSYSDPLEISFAIIKGAAA